MSKSKTLVIQRLKDLMGEESQNSVAKSAGIAQASVGRILNDNQSATVDLLDKLARAFEVHPASFLLDDEETELLNQFRKLNNDDKLKVLGYIGFAISQYSTQNKKLDHEYQVEPSQSITSAVRRSNSLPLPKKMSDEKEPKLSRRSRNS